MNTPLNLFESLERASDTHPSKTALIFQNQRMSYDVLLGKVLRLSEALFRLGLRKGDRIALWLENRPEFVVGFYAAMRLGLITVGLNIMFKEDEAGHILRDASPKAVLTRKEFLPVLRRVFPGPSKTRPAIIITGGSTTASEGAFLYEELTTGPVSDLAIAPPNPEDLAVIGYTSGTTGFPKGAAHTHANILSHLEGIANHLHIGPEDVFLAALPFFQLVAFLIHPALAIHVGGTVIIMEKFEPQAFLGHIHDEGVTFFAGVPTLYQMIYARSRQGPVNLGHVRFGICAGAPISPRLRVDFETDLHFRIIHCYGLTEISLIAACEDPRVAPKGVSVGKVLPYIRLRLLTESGTEAAPGEAGEICIGLEMALRSYWNDPEGTAASLREGWFSTGDIGRFDSEGNLHIVDRKKDMIIRGGFNIYPAEIERVLSQDPRIAQIAVVGEPHERLGEVPKAFVVLKEGCTMTEDELISMSRQKLASFKTLDSVSFVPAGALPLNALGKIVKSELRKPIQ